MSKEHYKVDIHQLYVQLVRHCGYGIDLSRTNLIKLVWNPSRDTGFLKTYLFDTGAWTALYCYDCTEHSWESPILGNMVSLVPSAQPLSLGETVTSHTWGSEISVNCIIVKPQVKDRIGHPTHYLLFTTTTPECRMNLLLFGDQPKWWARVQEFYDKSNMGVVSHLVT